MDAEPETSLQRPVPLQSAPVVTTVPTTIRTTAPSTSQQAASGGPQTSRTTTSTGAGAPIGRPTGPPPGFSARPGPHDDLSNILANMESGERLVIAKERADRVGVQVTPGDFILVNGEQRMVTASSFVTSVRVHTRKPKKGDPIAMFPTRARNLTIPCPSGMMGPVTAMQKRDLASKKVELVPEYKYNIAREEFGWKDNPDASFYPETIREQEPTKQPLASRDLLPEDPTRPDGPPKADDDESQWETDDEDEMEGTPEPTLVEVLQAGSMIRDKIIRDVGSQSQILDLCNAQNVKINLEQTKARDQYELVHTDMDVDTKFPGCWVVQVLPRVPRWADIETLRRSIETSFYGKNPVDLPGVILARDPLDGVWCIAHRSKYPTQESIMKTKKLLFFKGQAIEDRLALDMDMQVIQADVHYLHHLRSFRFGSGIYGTHVYMRRGNRATLDDFYTLVHHRTRDFLVSNLGDICHCPKDLELMLVKAKSDWSDLTAEDME